MFFTFIETYQKIIFNLHFPSFSMLQSHPTEADAEGGASGVVLRRPSPQHCGTWLGFNDFGHVFELVLWKITIRYVYIITIFMGKFTISTGPIVNSYVNVCQRGMRISWGFHGIRRSQNRNLMAFNERLMSWVFFRNINDMFMGFKQLRGFIHMYSLLFQKDRIELIYGWYNQNMKPPGRCGKRS